MTTLRAFLFGFIVLSGLALQAQTEIVFPPMEDTAPSSADECREITDKAQKQSDVIGREHQDCLDAAQNAHIRSVPVHQSSDCSQVSCQSLHTLMMTAASYVKVAGNYADGCRDAWNKKQEEKRKAEEEARQRKEEQEREVQKRQEQTRQQDEKAKETTRQDDKKESEDEDARREAQRYAEEKARADVQELREAAEKRDQQLAELDQRNSERDARIEAIQQRAAQTSDVIVQHQQEAAQQIAALEQRASDTGNLLGGNTVSADGEEFGAPPSPPEPSPSNNAQPAQIMSPSDALPSTPPTVASVEREDASSSVLSEATQRQAESSVHDWIDGWVHEHFADEDAERIVQVIDVFSDSKKAAAIWKRINSDNLDDSMDAIGDAGEMAADKAFSNPLQQRLVKNNVRTSVNIAKDNLDFIERNLTSCNDDCEVSADLPAFSNPIVSTFGLQDLQVCTDQQDQQTCMEQNLEEKIKKIFSFGSK